MHELDVFHCPLDGVHLIEASAGTGKTWNLCALYLRLLLEQQRRVEEILVVTFTKAATAELKERIRCRLAELSRALENGKSGGGDPFIGQLLQLVIAGGRVSAEEAKHRLRLALECFDQAAIFTIHGFCQRALAETPFAASQPFQFDFLAEDSLLAHETAADFWRRHVGQGPLDDGLVATLLDKGLGPDWLASHLARRGKKPLSRLIWPDFASSPVADLASLNQAVTTAKALWQDSAPAICQTILSALAQLKATSYKEASLQAAAEAWSRYFTSELGLRPIDDRQKLLALDCLVKGTKKDCRTPSHPFFVLAQTILDLSQAAQDAWAMQQRRLLHDWLAEGPEEFLRRKLDRRLLSYDDLLSRLHHALCSGEFPWLAAELHRRYPCALIDEFQDTDPLQFQIFAQIMTAHRRGPIFLIGDPKQAIYSFRNADLNTYLAARQSADSQATLQANQRSTPGVIRAVNDLFTANPSVFILPNLAYQAVTVGLKPRLTLCDHSGEERADLQVWLLPGDDEGLLLKDEARQAVTVATAAEISRLLAAADITIGEARLKPADIAVLVRSHRQGSAVKRALTALGIGCVELGQSSVFESGQAEEVERVLRAVSVPGHLPSLKAALATELLGQDAQAIEAVNGDEESLSAWVQVFSRLRELWLEQGFGVFWRALLRQQGAAVTVLSLAGGERKWTNFLHLGELLQEAAAQQPGIDGLLRWLAANRAALESPGDSAQLRLESDENLVSILTVHKAKGLEFPIVFCPFLFDGWSASPGRELEGIEYHQGGQGVIDFSLAEAEVAAAKELAKGELAAESARLLYVALTRAVYRCYLVAGCYGIATRGRPSLKESARSTLNWLAAGAGMPFAQWQEGTTPAAAIEAAWQGLATKSAGAIGLTALPTSPGLVLAAEAHHGGDFAARQPALHFPPSWRLSSFSALNRLSEHESAIPDHDTSPQPPAHGRGEPPAGLRQDDFLRFPQGPAAGECLHRVLELADFSQPASWDEAIRRGLVECPPASLEGQGPEHPALAAMLRTLMADLLTTPLAAEGLVLSSLSRDQCLTELEFSFPAGRVTANEVNRLLGRLGYAQPKLSFPVLHGFIKGFIDLLFCHQGQYFLLDWKSNHLGFTAADYGPEPLAQAMHHHGYHLQYLLYAVAVHRFLALRLPGYDFNRHFGGVLYLFVRGVRPGWKNADGSPSGVYYHRPSLAGLEQLDHLFHPES